MSTNKSLVRNFSRIMNQIIQVGSVPMHTTCQDFPINIYGNRKHNKMFMKQNRFGEEKKNLKNPHQ